MTWKVFGERYDTLAALEATQDFTFDDDLFLRGSQDWFVFFSSPTFTTLSMNIYSDRNGSPGAIVKTSSKTWTKAEIIAEGTQLETGAAFTDLRNGVIKLYWDWDDFPLKGGTKYHMVFNATGYTGDENSHIAWRKGWPDPVYTEGFTTTIISAAKDPRMIAGFVGSDI